MKLPLLYKELCEKASSKNLYRIRLLYGVVLYSCFLWGWYTNTLWSFNALGKGRTVLNYVLITNLVSILLFVPTISAATIARERERNTLPLLLICKISPWQILFEKFISLVIISFSLVMMSFPLMYLSYTLGGVSNQDILSSILAQLLIIIHIIAVALFCSCHARNTSQAIIATYTLIFILFWELGILFINPSSVYNKKPFASINIYLSLFLLVIAVQGMAKNKIYKIKNNDKEHEVLSKKGYFISYLSRSEKYMYAICITGFLVCGFVEPYINIYLSGSSDSWCSAATWLFCYIIAVFFILRCLPTRHPVLWRDIHKNMRTVYFLVIIFTLEMVIFGISHIRLKSWGGIRPINFAILRFYIVLCIFMLVVILRSAHLFKQEKDTQTWNALMSTPITTQSLFWQKTIAVTHLALSISIVMALWGTLAPIHRINFFHIFFTISFLQWVAILFGLKVKKNAQLYAVAISILWCLFPVITTSFPDRVLLRHFNFLHALFSPFHITQGFYVGILYDIEGTDIGTLNSYLLTILLCFAAYKCKDQIRIA